MRLIFMGTPDFAAVSLRRVVESGHEVCGVFTQPDRPGHRGKVTPSPVKEYALSRKLAVFQPQRLRDGEALETVRALAPDIIVVVAYGRILPREILEAPPLGCVNVHASLLPKYRGAAPVHWAILNGERETGVCLMHMTEELDAGDIIASARTDIGPEEELASLWSRLAQMGAALLTETLPRISRGAASRTPQDPAGATYAPMLSRALSPIDWERPAGAIACQIRGLMPWPCASAEIGGQHFKIYRAAPGERTDRPPGTVTAAGDRGIQVACGGGESLWIQELQAAGGRRMKASDYLRGHRLPG